MHFLTVSRRFSSTERDQRMKQGPSADQKTVAFTEEEIYVAIKEVSKREVLRSKLLPYCHIGESLFPSKNPITFSTTTQAEDTLLTSYRMQLMKWRTEHQKKDAIVANRKLSLCNWYLILNNETVTCNGCMLDSYVGDGHLTINYVLLPRKKLFGNYSFTLSFFF